MMVAPNDPFEGLKKNLEVMKMGNERLGDIQVEGFISPRLRKYCEYLLMLNHSADEMEVYASLRDEQRLINSGLEMKWFLEGVATIILADREVQEKVVGGIRVLANPNLDNVEKYQSLYDFAQEIYDNAVDKCSQILGGAA